MRRLLLASTGTLALALMLLARTASAAPDAGAPAKVVGPPDKAWKDMTKEEKGKYMKAVVVPKMKPTFQAFDDKEFAKFNCATCHGKEAKKREFKMPNPEIHALPDNPEEFQALMKKKPTWPKFAKFMGEQVSPQMAALLGKPAFDHKKPVEGAFSCNGCHELKKGLKD
jgi:cytochrome c553